MVWRTFSGVAFVTALFEALEAFIEVFAPLLRLEDKGFLLVWVWCRGFHVIVVVWFLLRQSGVPCPEPCAGGNGSKFICHGCGASVLAVATASAFCSPTSATHFECSKVPPKPAAMIGTFFTTERKTDSHSCKRRVIASGGT